jgi:hypothetical protein
LGEPAPVHFEMGEEDLAVLLAIMTLLRAGNSRICQL